MKKWQGLDYFVPRLKGTIMRAPRDMDLRGRAAWVSLVSLWGAADGPTLHARGVDLDDPESYRLLQGRINMSVLAILSGAKPPVWLCRPSASAIVHGTDLHSIPNAPPKMLCSPGIVEARRPETGERLWGNVASLGWYEMEGAIYLLGLFYPDGYAVVRWEPEWTGDDLEHELPAHDDSPLISDQAEHLAFRNAAARYLIVLGLLAEAVPSPLRIELDKSERWRRHVFLTDKAMAAQVKQPPPPLPGASRLAVDAPITGHLKRQRYGEHNALVKWIYVEDYSARRWRGPRWIVSAREAP